MAKKKTTTGKLTRKRLGELHFDMENPRFGGRAGDIKTETATLDYIVDNFGIEDVISSIAANGYFESEPLVGVQDKDEIRILEGNRRLAACLILAGDPRATQQQKRIDHAKSLMAESGVEPPEDVPVLVVTAAEQKQQMLAYLGVRHICGLSEWDSYAKAVWIANVLDESKLTLERIKRMIGDQHGTSPRILEGYYFVKQLVDRDRFLPEQSYRRGRGSNPEYPFSWVYAALGYHTIRAWLAMDDSPDHPAKDPIESHKLDDAAMLMQFLFGNKETRAKPAIIDSREIGNLANCIADRRRLMLLTEGRAVQELDELLKSPRDRLLDALHDANNSLALAATLVTRDEIDGCFVEGIDPLIRRVMASAKMFDDESCRCRLMAHRT